MAESSGEPPIKRVSLGRRAALVTGGVAAAGLILAVVLSVTSRGPRTPQPQLPADVIELVPEPLAKETTGGQSFDPHMTDAMPVLSEGGSIQTSDADGNLAQEYRFRRLDPNPEGMPAGWVQMDHPSAEFYLKDDRVIALTGDSALVHLRRRVLESGTVTGNVVIRLFEPPPGHVLDLARDQPLLEVHTGEATFDNVIGEVRCPGRFHVEASWLESTGRSLTILVDDRQKRPQLNVEIEELELLRLVQTAGSGDAAAPSPAAGAGRAKPSGREPAPPDDGEPAQFYRLTLHDHVRIREGPEPGRRTASGDSLNIVFSTRSEGLAPALAIAPTTTGFGWHALTAGWHALTAKPQSMSSLSHLTFACFALTGQSMAQDMALETPIAPPPGEDDIYVTCSGGLTMVRINDPAQYLDSPRDARLTLTGRPVELFDRQEQAGAECHRLLYHALDERIELVGTPSQPLIIHTPQLSAGGETFWITSTKGGFTGRGWLTVTRDEPEAELPGGSIQDEQAVGGPRLHMTWAEGVDLEFDEPADGSKGPGDLRRAAFHGAVSATGENGDLDSNELDLRLRTDERGQTVPTSLKATGEVRAANPDQTMWADEALVTFRPRRGGPDRGDGGGDLFGEGVEVERMTAEGDVQVLLSGGARAFADRLVGDADGETVELTGDDVAIAYGQWLIDGGRLIHLDRTTETAHWDGSGTARMFAETLPVTNEGRVEREFNATPQVRASWNEAMDFDQSRADGAGAVDLLGGVEMVSEPGPLERTVFHSETVTLELAESDKGEGPESPTGEDRRLGRVIARGDARLDHRTWVNEDRSDLPRVFYLAGEQLEYDERTGEAVVPVAGELLIRDLRPARASDEREEIFAARGTTAFRWSGTLHMTRRSGTVYDIVMLDDIEMRHLSPDQQSSTLTGSRIEVAIDRPQTQDATLDGPQAELLGLRAEGRVFLHTPARDVDCDEFDYDVELGLARIGARPGEYVTIYTRGVPEPIRVRQAEWDLIRDEIHVRRGAGGGTR